MRVTKKSMMLMLALIALVSCGGGGGGSSSNAPTPVNMEINLKGDVSKVPVGQLKSERTKVPNRPNFENEDKGFTVDLVAFSDGGSDVISSGQVSSLSYGFVNRRIEHPSQLTIKKDGVAFLINGGISGFSDNRPLENQVKDYVEARFRFSPTALYPNPDHLQNLTLTMEKGSILFASIGGDVKLSQIGKNSLFSQTTNKPTIIGNDYKELLLAGGNFTIDKNVNLDDLNDAFNRVKIESSSVTNQTGIEIKGAENNLIGIGQKEQDPSTPSGISLKNNGTINLSGENVIGMYKSGYQTGKVENNGAIIVGKNSVGMYVLDRDYDSGRPNEEDVLNTGNINVGENSIGMYYEDVPLDDFNYFGGANFNGGMHNTGNIRSNSKNVIGMYMNSDSTDLRDSLNQKMDSEKFLINTGNIELLGDSSIGMLAKGSRNYSVANAGTIRIGDSLDKNNPSIGMYTESDELSLNNMEIINIGKNSIGIYGVKNKGVVKNIGYSIGSGYSVRNHSDGKIELNGKGAIGIYLDDGAIGINDGSITTINVDGGSIGVAGIKDSEFLNNGTISVNEGSVGVYGNGNNAILKNEGIISVGRNSVGMYSAKGATVENNKTIKLVGDDSIGMYVADNSKGINNGEITTDGIVNRAIGVALGKNAEFTNNGKIVINSNEGIGIVNAGGIIKNYGDIQVTGDNSLREKRVDNVVIKTDGIITPMSYIQKAPALGLYVDTEGKTNPIKGIEKLGVSKVDLLIGAEAANSTNDTTVEVSKEVLKPYSNTIEQVGLNNVSVKSGALTWNLESETSNKGIKKAILTKKSYVVFTGDTETAKLAQGLDERYRLSALGSEERQLFTYLNSLGPNDKNLLEKAFKEISGNQYINTQRRIKESSAVLDKEISDLYKEFDYSNETGSKIKTFVNSGKYDTNIEGIYDYKNQGYGIAYVYNNSDKKYGITAGAGANTYKLKDDGKSKEKINMLKVGAYKTFELGNAADWTLSGNGFYGRNEMERRYIVGNNEYSGKADYDVYGFGMRNEISKKVRLGNNFVFKPYTALNTEYGKFENIKEKDGALRLEVKGNDYYSIKPEAGVEFNIEKPVFKNSKIKASFSTGYEYELGKVDNLKNKARLVGTSGQWYELRKSKEEDKGNLKADVKVGFEAGNFGVTLNGGYDTNGKNVRGGLGIKASF